MLVRVCDDVVYMEARSSGRICGCGRHATTRVHLEAVDMTGNIDEIFAVGAAIPVLLNAESGTRDAHTRSRTRSSRMLSTRSMAVSGAGHSGRTSCWR